MRETPMWDIIFGDSIKVLSEFEPGTFDAVITDPPYASGGRTQAEKNKSTRAKYSSMGEKAPPAFDGDAKDQRSWTTWCAQWLGEARRVSKPGAPVCVFIDWRQLPSLTDALQWAGWIWRGIAVWDKGSSRPQRGRFRQQAEFIVWGSNGDMSLKRPVPCLPGVFKVRQSPEPHPPDRKALTAYAGYCADHGTGRPRSGPLRGIRFYALGRGHGRLPFHRD